MSLSLIDISYNQNITNYILSLNFHLSNLTHLCSFWWLICLGSGMSYFLRFLILIYPYFYFLYLTINSMLFSTISHRGASWRKCITWLAYIVFVWLRVSFVCVQIIVSKLPFTLAVMEKIREKCWLCIYQYWGGFKKVNAHSSECGMP